MGIWKAVGDGEWVGTDAHPTLNVYTRGNAGEVYPEVFTPLSFSLASEISERGMRNALLGTGMIRASEVDGVPLSTAMAVGVFGGYAYLNLATQRLLSARVPGGEATDADLTFFGVGQDVPPHRPVRGERNLRASLAGLAYVWRTVRARSIPLLQADLDLVERYIAALPDPEAVSDGELADTTTDDLLEHLGLLFQHHLEVSAAASTCVSLLSQLCERQLKDPGRAVRLLAGLGDVDSAAPSMALWDLGRMVAADPGLSDRFATVPMEDLWQALTADPDAAAFVVSFRSFLDRFGSRGPNEWDTAFDTWALRSDELERVGAGATLTGLPGCPGVARGRARVVLDPADPRGLEPGDVLVAPLTDPSWTPLFVPAEAVVVDVGAVMSHAVIVSRELGIPCAVSVADATRRIPDGAEIEVDGSTGTVTVLSVPAPVPEA